MSKEEHMHLKEGGNCTTGLEIDVIELFTSLRILREKKLDRRYKSAQR